ncbi:NAD(P)-binding domain-containing protein [Nocardioides sp.]|jgi:predicted dinucleotide-binding enzyme|uniref:NADPH-dependent F420 reductase n=1 Tax=Nocardioides sp. TaxID=35761 RepID=UPI0031FEC7A1|nr:oxidoreductase coenzyme F420-dependent [Nocardioides sp.]
MKIAVLGTGPVGQNLASRLAEVGHVVTMGTRDPDATMARTDDDGSATYAAWQKEHPDVRLETFDEAARQADLVVNASGGDVALAVLDQAGGANLAGKVLVDVSNPLDHSQGFPPGLFVKDTDSLAEQIQRAHPDARVVKTLNTMNNDVMVRPEALGASTTVFLSGDDVEAKAIVTGLLESFGHDDVLDLGELSTARGAEMFLPLWIRLRLALGTNAFNIKVVRGPGTVDRADAG